MIRRLAIATLALSCVAAPALAEKKRAFVEETRIAAPRHVGDFVLERTKYDPANVTVTLSADQLKSGATVGDVLAQLAAGSVLNRNHCYDRRGQAKQVEPDDAEIVTIEYDAADWGEPE